MMTVKEEEEEEDEEGLADPRGCQLQKLEDDPLLRVEFRVLPGGGDDVSVERDVVQTAQFCQRETILEEDCARSRRKWKYWLSITVVSLFGNIGTGYILGFSAVFLPQLSKEREVTTTVQSLIASIISFSQMFGAILCGMVANRFGRRKSIALFTFLTSLGWIIIGVSNGDEIIILVGRAVCGFGIMTSTGQIFLTEVSPPKYRGIAGACGPLGVCMGITLVYIYGAFLHWTYICYLSGAVAFFTSVVALVSLPESPIWLFIQGREEETVYILQKLRGMPANSKEIIEELKCMSDAKNMRASDESNIIHELTRPESYKPILLILAIFFLVNFSGAFAFLAYGVDLVKDFGFSEDIQYIPAIIVSSMRLIGTILGVFLFIPYFQRKTLMISTAVVMFLCHIGIALVSYLQNMSFVSESVAKWISLILMCAYLVTFGSGAGTIPWSLAGELTTMKIRGISSGFAICMAYLSAFLSVFSYKFIQEYLGSTFLFLTLGISSLAVAGITKCFMPETKGKSEAEIAQFYK